MFRTLVKTDALAVDRPDVRRAVLRAAHAARRAALQRRDPARPGDRIILDDDSVIEPRGASDAAGAGDALQPDAGARADRRLIADAPSPPRLSAAAATPPLRRARPRSSRQ